VTTVHDAPRLNAWQRFRVWRRGCPFWGGLLSFLAGAEIFMTTQQDLGEMQVKVGLEGFQAYLIPLMLIFAGFLAWFTPAQRHFYGLVAQVIAVYALIGVNLGGWFIGTILGMIGGALIFAWSPSDAVPATRESSDGERDGDPLQDEDEDAHHEPRHAAGMDDLLDGPMTDTLPQPVNPLAMPEPVSAPEVPTQRAGSDEDPGRGRLLAVTLVPLLFAAAGILVTKGAEPAYAACTTPRVPSSATRSPVPRTSSTAPTTSPSTSSTTSPPTTSPTVEPSPLRSVIGGIVGLLEGSSIPSPSVSASTAAPKIASSPAASPTASKTVAPRRPSSPCPSTSPIATTPAKHLTAAAGQPNVAAKPSRMTGSTVTMTNLMFQGVVDLPTAGGTITVLKFTMDQSVTDDFLLHVYGPNGNDVEMAAKKLTVKTDVVFYASRFQGKLLGLVPVDYTPTNPPLAIPQPLIFFTDPDIQLVWVNSDALTAPHLVTKFV
jgi:hypothetical protein